MTADRTERDKATLLTSRSFAVEASAGTGKTGALVARILRLVLEEGPIGKPIPVSAICAITFTEKAAGEMKIRLREEFEREARRGGEKGDRALEALRELDAAAISTFHSFAVSLLKERPVEAALDPRFTTLDELRTRLFFLEVWEPWIDRALSERHKALEAALRQGIGLERIRDLASTLQEHMSEVRRLRLASPVSDDELSAELAGLRKEGSGFAGLYRGTEDMLDKPLTQAIAWLEDPESQTAPPVVPKGGRAANWVGGRDTVEGIRDFLTRVRECAGRRAQAPQQRAFFELARWLIDDFLPEWERRKRVAGYLDFNDQLEAARRLLSKSRPARREFQKRYATLLVDEFQDTDAIQLEIVLLLSCTDLAETDPSRMKIAPGRLFVVGDPKQSIYRFRGADVETYQEVVDEDRLRRLGLERLRLTANFRSIPSILRFVDAAFANAMTRQGLYQCDYLPFGKAGSRSSPSAGPAVCLLGDRDSKGEIAGEGKSFVKLEAGRIAKLIRRMVDGGDWMVEDDGPVRRRAAYGDIMVLLPVLSRVDLLETELRQAGILYVLEGGKFYYTRSEVASAITVLKAVGNPADHVSLYGALRSIFFGLSDEDLLRAKIAGLPLDYRAQIPEDSPLCLPYRLMHDLHLRRHSRPASETLEALLQHTGAREVLAVRGLQSVANLGKLVRQFRMLQEHMTFSEVLSLLGTIEEEDIAESESRLMEEHSDAVRLMTIHKAKGLDSRIVIVAGLGLERGQHPVSFLADAHGKKEFALSIGSVKDGWRTRNWNDLKEGEKKREDAELLRLLYVSLTRARDHLVVSVHTKGKPDKTSGLIKADFGGTRLAPIGDFLCGVARGGDDLARFLDGRILDGDTGQAREVAESSGRNWGAALREEYRELDRLLFETAASLDFRVPASAGERNEVEEQAEQDARSRAIRLGVAFHEVMEVVELSDDSYPSFTVDKAGARHGLDAQAFALLGEMVTNCLRSTIVGRARRALEAGRRSMRELPYVRPIGSGSGAPGVEEGKIDLLFEEDGGWVLVDYKTDRLPEEVEDISSYFRQKYRAQIDEYVSALGSMGVKVKAACILLARNGEELLIGSRNATRPATSSEPRRGGRE